jgi:hypothetical protein
MDSKSGLTQAHRGGLVRRTAFALLAVAALLAGWLFLRERAELPRESVAPARTAAAKTTGSVRIAPAAKQSERPAADASGYLAGKVLRADGRPAPGAEVLALGTDAVTAAGMDGAFTIDVPAGEQRLIARLGDETALMPAPAMIKAGETTSGIVLRLAGAASFEGTIDDEEGKPLAGARITANVSTGESIESVAELSQAAVSDSGGRYRISGLPPGIYALRALAPGFDDADRARLGLTSGKRFQVDFRLRRLGAVEGTVSDEAGHPVADAVVAIVSWNRSALRETRTSADGHYRFDGLRPDLANLQARRDSSAPSVMGVVLEFENGKVARLDFRLSEAGTLSGVVSQEGKPAPGAQLYFSCDDSRVAAAPATTDAAGRYRVALLPGRYEVHAQSGQKSGSARTSIRGGQAAELDLTLDGALEPRSTITGVVLDERGMPAAGVRVSLKEGPRFDEPVTSGADGRFELRAWRANNFTVTAQAGGKAGSVEGVGAGADVVVKISATANLSGHVRGVRGDGFEVSAGGHNPVGFTGDEFLLTDLPAGASTVTVRDAQHDSGSAEVVLIAGETADVTVSLEQRQPVAVTVLDAKTQRPVPHARVTAGDRDGNASAGEDGKATIYLTEDQHQLSIEAGNHQTLSIPVGQSPMVVELQPLAPGGVGIAWDWSDRSRCLIQNVLAGGPAEKAGLRAGDVIYAVNGISVTDARKTIGLVRGPIGEPVTLQARRDGAPMSFTLVRVDLAALPP